MPRKKKREIAQFIDYLMSEEALTSTLSQLGVFIVDYKKGRSISNQLWDELGHPDDIIHEQRFIDLLHPEDRKRVAASLKEVVNGEQDYFREVYRFNDGEGGWRWITNRGAVVYRKDDGTPWLFIGADDDLTRIKQAQEEASLRAREAGTLNATIEVITSSLNLDETVVRILEQARRVVPYNRATVQILHKGELEILGGMGFSDPQSVIGMCFPYPQEGSLSTRAIQERRPWMSNDIRKDFPGFVDAEPSQPTRSWIGVPLIAHGDVIGLIAFDADETEFYNFRHLEISRAFAGPVAIALENARLHEETYKLAMEDALTGIGSRHSFDLNSRYLFEKARREERFLTVAMIDLDRFKEVNDDFGHQVGDDVLRAVARTCEGDLRASDMIARYGGEEIIILFPDTDIATAVDIVERIRNQVEHLRIEGVDRSVTISGGVAGIVPGRDSSLSNLIADADASLYRAKSAGRNRVESVNP